MSGTLKSSVLSQKAPQNHRSHTVTGLGHHLVRSSPFTDRSAFDDEALRREMIHQDHQWARAEPRSPASILSLSPWQPYFIPALYTLPVLTFSFLSQNPGQWTLRIYHMPNCGSKPPNLQIMTVTHKGWAYALINMYRTPSPCPIGKNSNWYKKLNCLFLLLLNSPKGWNTQWEANPSYISHTRNANRATFR